MATSPLAELREMNVRKKPERTTNPPVESDKSENKQTDNMTSHITNKQTDKPESQKTNSQEGSPVARPDETLKTVTLKLPPTLDRRVERYCFESDRKKQDVVRDALLMYLAAVEAQEGEGEA